MWYINKGIVKALELIDGSERVTYFFLDQLFFTNYYSWVTSDTSAIAFKTVEPSEIIEIDYLKLEALCKSYHTFDRIAGK